jgi:glycerophosphoryl diester phosphodiesterase
VKWTPPPRGYWRVAHRGASALALDNSLTALEAALAAPVDMVELDVVEVGGELRLAHSLRELRPESPALEEALALFVEQARPEVRLDLDVKAAGFEARLLACLRSRELLDRTLVSSFHPRVLRSVRAVEPGVATGLSYPNDRFELSERSAFRPFVTPGLAALRALLPARIGRMLRGALAEAAMLHHALVTPGLVARCHERGAAVFAWTVETDEDLRRVLAAGADGVIANDHSLFGQ